MVYLLSLALFLDGRTLSPLALAKLSLDEARSLDGQTVLVWLDADAPPYELDGAIVTGVGESRDGVERSVILPSGSDIREGQRITVTGRLRVIRHIAGGGFPGFAEIRIVTQCLCRSGNGNTVSGREPVALGMTLCDTIVVDRPAVLGGLDRLPVYGGTHYRRSPQRPCPGTI